MSDNPQSEPTKITRQARWQADNPLERWAHRAFESAVKRGLVQRQPCEECGATENVDFHHFPGRYHEPLSGRFLCRGHHNAEHARLRRKKGGGDG